MGRWLWKSAYGKEVGRIRAGASVSRCRRDRACVRVCLFVCVCVCVRVHVGFFPAKRRGSSTARHFVQDCSTCSPQQRRLARELWQGLPNWTAVRYGRYPYELHKKRQS